MLTSFILILSIQIAFFLFAAIKKTDKVTDLSYGLTFVVVSIVTLLQNIESINTVKIILTVLISIWGIRLSSYLFLRILKIGKDKRFDGIRENTKSFASFWLLQAVSIFLILSPVTYLIILDVDMNLSIVSILGFLVATMGIALEGIADQQKFVFKSNPMNKDMWIQSGVWKYSRHPNYLGEIMMWVGVFIYVLPYISGLGWLTIISPIFISILLLFISGIPTLEKKYNEKYKDNADYQNYVKNTGILIPKF